MGYVLYLCGKISGAEKMQNRRAMRMMAQALTEKGFVVLHTADMPDGLPEHVYMLTGLGWIPHVTAVAQMPGWSESKGAQAEVALGRKLNKPLIHAELLLSGDGRGWKLTCGAVPEEVANYA